MILVVQFEIFEKFYSFVIHCCKDVSIWYQLFDLFVTSCRIPPNSDSAGDSIELIYVNNLREHEAMLKLQEEMLTSAKRQTKLNSARVRNMYKIQERLRRRFIEVNSFIKDCADKKRVAEKTAQAETLNHKELGEGIESFKDSIGELKAFREALKATVQEFQPYEKVLDEVVKVSDIFVSPKDCTDRCDALSEHC